MINVLVVQYFGYPGVCWCGLEVLVQVKVVWLLMD